MIQRLAIVGCGLMGGSVALALRRAGMVRHIVGCSRSPASSQQAVELGVIDEVCASAAEAARGADVVLLSVPVASTLEVLEAIRMSLMPGALCMDVGSTKRDVVAAARAALGAAMSGFVPAHPIAGNERSGVEAATADLYFDRRVILTPLAETDPRRLRSARALWKAMGGVVTEMSPEEHDRAFAAVSHLPHLLAFACVAAVAQASDGERMLQLAGPGVRDFTRIAGAEPAMWRDILLANRDEVLAQVATFRQKLEEMERAMSAGDARTLQALISAPSALRNAWTMGVGMGSANASAVAPAAADES
ncbi:MAG: prephenate dehydrogenase [Rubrivivax sp.]